MGNKDFEAANCVRALLGETAEAAGEIAELRCNLDDMTPEAVGFAQERLFEAGALDVYTVPVGMKKMCIRDSQTARADRFARADCGRRLCRGSADFRRSGRAGF